MDSASSTNTATESEPVNDDAQGTRRDYSGRGNLRRMRNAVRNRRMAILHVRYGSYWSRWPSSRWDGAIAVSKENAAKRFWCVDRHGDPDRRQR